MIAGERDPKVLAQMARAAMRGKITALQEAFTGFFTDRHALLLQRRLARVDAIDADIAALDARIEEMVAPFARQSSAWMRSRHQHRHRISDPGRDRDRYGPLPHRRPPGLLGQVRPGARESAGKKGKNSTGHGSSYLARVPGNAAVAAGRSDTFPGERYRPIARRGRKKAVVVISRSLLVIIWHLLTNPDACYTDLGSDSYGTRVSPEPSLSNSRET